MSCETGRTLMTDQDPALAAHLESCASCAIGAAACYYEASPLLAEKIRRTLGREPAPPSRWRLAAIAASLLLVASLAGNLNLLNSRITPRQLTADTILSAHIRSLAGTHLLDVASTDRHTVKPWFNGKVDFSPKVDAIEGFPLLGGRLEYLNGRLAAALVYGRSQHIINLFTWPASAPASEMKTARQGYRLEDWSDDGFTSWAVSDLNEYELHRFVSLYRGRR